jgi:site-specific DNA-methyltransferase (adenine-specific)
MPRPKRGQTSTSSFGSPGRVSHDASSFYNSQLYAGLNGDGKQPASEAPAYIENPLPDDLLDRVVCSSAEEMRRLPDHSVHLMVTSPPYNVGKEYDQDLTLEDYLAFLRRVWEEVMRVLVPGGRACVNVANLGRKPYIPLHAYIERDMQQAGFLMRGEIIWNKAASASQSTAWGSWRSAGNPTLRDVHEYILVFSKGSFQRKNPVRRPSTITREDFLEWTRSVWTIPAEPARKVGHPAPFPVELPRRLIELYTFAGEIVLDPFMGSGQTALAALHSERHFTGYEIDPQYVDLARQRIQAAGFSPPSEAGLSNPQQANTEPLND